MLEGRSFSATDTPDHPDVVIVNEAMAKRFWPNESPLGKRIKQPGPDNKWQEVVGVVNDVGFPGTLGEPYTRLQTFRPLVQSPWGGGWIISVRSAITPEAFTNELRNVVAGLDRDLPVYDIRTAQSMVEEGLGSVSLLGTLLGAFALLGLTLAAIGIYGVTSYSVVQRTGELGIRMALGAQRKDVLWLVLGKGSLLMLSGTAIGLGGAYAVARLLIWSIPTLPTNDPITIAATTFVLVMVALIACYIPAHRATKVDPMVALRSE
jgi:putative ABC transport system permease protein